MGGRARYSGQVDFCGVITVDGDVFDMDISFDVGGEPGSEVARRLVVNGTKAEVGDCSRHLRGRLSRVIWDLGTLVLLEIGCENEGCWTG